MHTNKYWVHDALMLEFIIGLDVISLTGTTSFIFNILLT